MSDLLDTNIVSAHMKQPARLAHRFLQHSGRLAIPSIVLAELYAGAHLRSDPAPLPRQIADLLIASTALAHGLTLVTHNTAHFASIPGLVAEDWLTP